MGLKIGWMIRAGGIFGSVREAIEVGNALMRRGHQFTMFTDEAQDLRWLPNTLSWAHTNDAVDADLDVLFWSDTPDDPYYDVFMRAKAKVKSYCVMGFDPLLADEVFTAPRQKALLEQFWTIADGAWQLPYLRKYSPNVGPAIGGVNIQMFRPVDVPATADVVWSGDPRERKGGDMVREAIKGFRSDYYSKKKVRQEHMANFICKAPIFVDGHKRGGHCNPVLEAMACGRLVVCTDTPCNSDFTVDGINCRKAATNDAEGLRHALGIAVLDPNPRPMLEAAIEMARRYDYNQVVIPLIIEMHEQLDRCGYPAVK